MSDPNAGVGAVLSKAMPVILTEPDELKVWMTAPRDLEKELQRSLERGAPSMPMSSMCCLSALAFQACNLSGRLSNAEARRIGDRLGFLMTTLARHLCALFAVAILAAMNLHGMTQSQHTMAHIADWPAVALVEVSDDHDHHGAHIHVAPDDVPASETEPSDRDVDGERPVSHHHHGGGDNHGAVPVLSRALAEASQIASITINPGSGPPLAGLSGDGIEYPPKRTLTVI